MSTATAQAIVGAFRAVLSEARAGRDLTLDSGTGGQIWVVSAHKQDGHVTGRVVIVCADQHTRSAVLDTLRSQGHAAAPAKLTGAPKRQGYIPDHEDATTVIVTPA